MLKLSFTLALQSFFINGNANAENGADEDFASGGPLLVPGTNRLVMAGKPGNIFVCDTANLGGYTNGANNCLQAITGANGLNNGSDGNAQAPVYWVGPGGPTVYYWAGRNGNNFPRAYRYNTGTNLLNVPAISTGTVTQGGRSGGITLSANGATSGTGILWSIKSDSGGNSPPGPGRLIALNAEDLTVTLYDSQQNAARDTLGNYSKLSYPTIADGRVYVPTLNAADTTNYIAVYGLLGGNAPTKLKFVSQPASALAGASIGTVAVAIVDVADNVVTSATGNVSLIFGSNPGGATLAGTTTVATVNGVATFSNLSVNNPGVNYTLNATSAPTAYTGATSTAFTITSATITQPPVFTPGAGSFSGPVTVVMNSATAGATIYYTTNGSTPTTASAVYNPGAPPQIGGTATVQAIATKAGLSNSTLTAATYTITGNTPYGMPTRGTLPLLTIPAAGATTGVLSSTGVFANTAALTPASGLVPYAVNSQLWSDAAFKLRWVALPNGSQISWQATGEFSYPNGTVFVKHFELGTDDSNPNVRKRLETRLLVITSTAPNAGYGLTYKWRADNSEADLIASTGLDEVVNITTPTGTRTQTWHYPSRNECLQCHLSNAGFVLGPKTAQINGAFTYPSTAVTDNQLRTWNYLRMFTSDIGEGGIPGLTRTVAIGDSSAPLETRVKSYLEANCSFCHRPGETSTAFTDARYATVLANMGLINVTPNKGAVGITPASDARIVKPTDPAHSVLSVRVHSLDNTIKMPPLARNLVDTTAAAVIDQWITGLPITGTGLKGDYFASQDKTFNGTPTLTRTDSTVDFNWGGGSPDPLIPADTFTVRWTGQVQAPFSEPITFYTTTDDGVRLWVNNVLVIDKWVDQGASEWNGAITLTAGVRYDIKLEYYENGGDAVARLEWSSPSTPRQVVPQSNLYPTNAPANAAPLVNAGVDQIITLLGTATLSGSASDDGLPNPPAALTLTWSKISGPGTVTFGNANAATTNATFGTAGSYVLRLTANDSAVSVSDDLIVTVNPVPTGGTGTGLAAAYFANQTLTGTATVTRTDATVNFDWGNGSPDVSIPVDHFSARWTGQVQAQFSETYTFFVTGDDGVCLWVNNVLLVDKWVDQPPTEWSGTIALTAGSKYDVKLEYFENAVGAVAQLAWASPSTAKAIVPQAQLYPTVTPTNAAPVVNAGADLAITLPAAATLSGSASDDGLPTPPAALTYAWSKVSGPGSVTFGNASAANTTATFGAIGSYTLRLSANDSALTGSDDVVVTVNPAPTIGTNLTNAYFANQTLTGTAALTRTDATVNFDWGNGSPGGTVPVDHFSTRWTGQVQTTVSETFTFYVTGDDGVRLWVNNVLIIDKWVDQGPTEWNGTVTLTAGIKYDLKLEYYENGGGAVAKLAWSSPSTTKAIVPQSQLYPAVAAPVEYGWAATYYDNADFTGASLARTDATINFDWGGGSPDASIGPETFSARWLGLVTPAASETYTFYVTGDDGVRLWVNNVLIIDKWIDQGFTTWTGTAVLTAGQGVAVKMEYYENGGGAVAKLEWSSASTARVVIPQSAVTPSGGSGVAHFLPIMGNQDR
ncbi:MAG TPA: PA14 domain-containing protein [Planctomycetota bacterium]|nr:PA14 domain-containing protein [Planctomycetota bacterium]